ncbi:MAG: hypothetical protein KDD94_04650 [Calditrichaeota bacterium]|nr:hypothetical protein [Calditrichota bacterium]
MITLFIFFIFLSCVRQDTSGLSNDALSIGQITKTFSTDITDRNYGVERDMMLQIWYPAKGTAKSAKRASYYPHLPLLLENGLISEDDYRQIKQFAVKSIADADYNSSSKRPLILFSPALGGSTANYTFFAEKLVEAGYLVVGVNHQFESEYILNSRDEIINSNLSFHDSLKTLSIPDQITADQYRIEKTKRMDVLAGDIIFALNQLKHEAIAELIDFDRIAFFGHSFGGGVVTSAAVNDALSNTIRLIINLDGTPPTLTDQQQLKSAYAFIEDITDFKNHQGYKKQYERRNAFCEAIANKSYRIMIEGIQHNSFSDTHFYSETDHQERKKAEDQLMLIFNYMRSLFDTYLLEKPDNIAETETDTLIIKTFN